MYKAEKFICLLGLPRSGTTMATAMFDVHPEIGAWFEPWNVRKKKEPKPYQSIEDFIKQYKDALNIDLTNKRGLMFKETTAYQEAIKWSEESLNNIKKNNPNIDIKVIWLIRDINHSYLSRVHTAKKHWGHPEMKIDVNSFKEFINFSYNGFKLIREVLENFDSCLLSYEKLVLEPKKTLEKVMSFIGIEMHPNQLEYYKHFKTHKSAGDPEVSSSPKPINPEKIKNRDEEWNKYKETFLNSLNDVQKGKYNEMMKLVDLVRENGFLKYNDMNYKE